MTVVSDSACDASTGLQQCVASPDTIGYSGQITENMLCASATGRSMVNCWWARY